MRQLPQLSSHPSSLEELDHCSFFFVISSYVVFGGLNLTIHSSAQHESLSRSPFSASALCTGLSMMIYKTVSSANNLTSEDWTWKVKSLIQNRNSNGARTYPCGTLMWYQPIQRCDQLSQPFVADCKSSFQTTSGDYFWYPLCST